MSYASDTDRQRRTEFVRASKGALRQGTTLEKRTAGREAKADEWTAWFHQRLNVRGGTPTDHLPDALAELEVRVADQVVGAIRELTSALRKALK
jgi:hypothetical protein